MKRTAYKRTIEEDDLRVLDVDALISRCIRLDHDTSKIEGLDASLDMPTAANIYQWLMDPRFCGQEGFALWPKQIYTLTSILEEYCPMPSCTDRRFFETMHTQTLDVIFGNITLLEHGKCPKCGGSKAEYLEEGLFHDINEVALCLGQRSSKTSMLAAMLLSYVLHHYLQLPEHPSKVLGLKPGQELYATLVAQSAKQAAKYPWTDFKNLYDHGRWFRDYNKRLTAIAEAEGWEISPVKVLDTRVEYRHRHLFVGFEPPNKRALRGATRFFAMIDEFGWFSEDDARETASASETEDALGNALLTVREAMSQVRKRGNMTMPNAFLAKSSSPHYVGDPIMRSVQQGKKEASTFVMHCATWEFHPTIQPPWVEGSVLAKEFAKRPEDSERSFGANPPMSKTPFHKNKAVFGKLGKEYAPRVKHSILVHTDELGLEYLYAKVKIKGPTDKVPRVISVDAGETKNSFAVTLLSLAPNGDGVVDAGIKIQPKTGQGAMAVHFQQVLEQCIFPMLEAFNVIAVIYDRWQSTSHVNQINDHPLFGERVRMVQRANPHLVKSKRDRTPTIGGAVQQSLVYNDFLEFDGKLPNLHIPALELPWDNIREMDLNEALPGNPNLELVFQIATVRDTGAKVTKPAVGDDDLYRAVVNGLTYMWDESRVAIFCDHSGAAMTASVKSVSIPIFVRSRGNRGAAAGSGSGKSTTRVGAFRRMGKRR